MPACHFFSNTAADGVKARWQLEEIADVVLSHEWQAGDSTELVEVSLPYEIRQRFPIAVSLRDALY